MTDDNTPDNGKKSVAPHPWHVYLLQCADGSLYAGSTNDLGRRLRQHNGELTGGARYTRVRRPVVHLWSQSVSDRSTACRLEARIKAMTRRQKMAVVRGDVVLFEAPNTWD